MQLNLQIAGIVFPVPVLLLIPIRQYILPHIFSGGSLHALDPAGFDGENNLENRQSRTALGPETDSTAQDVSHSQPSHRSSTVV